MIKNKYKNDYKVSPRMDYKGRIVDDYYYTGEYYCLSFDEKQKKRTRIYNMLFLIAFVTVWMIAGLINQDSSRTAWILFPYFFLLLPMIYFFNGAFGYWSVPLRMEKALYDTALGRMHRSGIGIIVMAIINIILDVIFIGLNIQTINIISELLYIGCLILVLLIGFIFAKFYDKTYANIVIEKVE